MFTVSDTVLEVNRVSKLYARRPKATRVRLGSILIRAMTGLSYQLISDLNEHEFWAVRDVSFTLKCGETQGIIGLNGSGKTTVLRMLAGQILPDGGEIIMRGKSVAMIDLTAGFQTGESGWANIFLRGAALGRSREEMIATVDEIVDFAELGDAIYAPVATYSSGMMMRLAFSIMIAATPDILLIDEILSVGDFHFRQKCLAKIREMRDRTAFVLISHSMQDIARFCDRVIVLNKGRIVFEGTPENAIEVYENMKFPKDTTLEQKQATVLGPQINNDSVLTEVEHYWCDEDGQSVNEIYAGESLYFHVAITLNYTLRHLIMGIPVWTEGGVYVTGFSTETTGDQFFVEAGKRSIFRLEVPGIAFNPGNYISNLTISDGPEFLLRTVNPQLTIRPTSTRHWGVVSLPHSWQRVVDSDISESACG